MPSAAARSPSSVNEPLLPHRRNHTERTSGGSRSYTIPKVDVQVSGTWASIPGDSLRADYAVTNAWIAGGPQPLGRSLTGAPTATGEPDSRRPRCGASGHNNIDFRVAKILRYRRDRGTQVGVDIFNLMNADTVTNYNYRFVPGGTWLTPTTIVPARYARISAQMDF